jgi:predicted Zn-dependent protease
MALDVPKLRKLLALDPDDALSRFALGNGLLTRDGSPAALAEAAEHLRVANAKAPEHLATYHLLAQALIGQREHAAARPVLERGIARAGQVTEGMGKDLAPAMRAMLAELPPAD